MWSTWWIAEIDLEIKFRFWNPTLDYYNSGGVNKYMGMLWVQGMALFLAFPENFGCPTL